MKVLKEKLQNILVKSRFVITVGDDGAVLVYTKGKELISRLYAKSESDEDAADFRKLLQSNPKVSISILVDTMDQNYSLQSLPPVGRLELGKLIKRRINRDFLEDDINGSINIGRRNGENNDWECLFISIANTPPLSNWISFVNSMPNPLNGIYSISIEGQNLIEKIYNSAFPNEKKMTGYQLLISHNKISGFRQIVIKNGKAIFTRLTQPMDDVVDAVTAGGIEQEIGNTVEYLKRPQFDIKEDELDIYVIASSAIKKILDLDGFKTRSAHIFAPNEIANILGVNNAIKESDKFGDIVFASFFASINTRSLKLFTKYTSKLNILYKSINACKWTAIIVLISSAIYFSYLGKSIYKSNQDISFSKQVLQDTNNELAKVQNEISKLPQDIDNIADIIAIYDVLSKGYEDPLPILAIMNEAMDENMYVDSFSWRSIDFLRARKTNTSQKATAIFNISLKDKIEDIDHYIETTDKFRDTLKLNLKDYDVLYTKRPGLISEDETWEEVLGGKQHQKKDGTFKKLELKIESKDER